MLMERIGVLIITIIIICIINDGAAALSTRGMTNGQIKDLGRAYISILLINSVLLRICITFYCLIKI